MEVGARGGKSLYPHDVAFLLVAADLLLPVAATPVGRPTTEGQGRSSSYLGRRRPDVRWVDGCVSLNRRSVPLAVNK